MKKLHFLFTNGSKFTLPLPDGTNVLDQVTLLTSFVETNETHVACHSKVYASTSKVKFPLSRGFYVGYESEPGKIDTLITPESKAIKYRGKALLLASLATEIEYRINAINAVIPFVGCSVNLTPQMCEALEREQMDKEQAKIRKEQKALNQVNAVIEG